MTQEELRAKLESYNIKETDTVYLLFDRDEARGMTLSYNNLRRTLYDYTSRDWALEPTDEVKDLVSKLISLISDESEMYDSFAFRLGQEMVERLNKKNPSDSSEGRE